MAVTDAEAKSAIVEFLIFVVDARAHHVSSDRSAEAISDIMLQLPSNQMFILLSLELGVRRALALLARRKSITV